MHYHGRFTWQLYWRKWHIGLVKEHNTDLDIYSNYLFIGPLQVHWYFSNVPFSGNYLPYRKGYVDGD